MTQEIEKKIQTLAEIRRDAKKIISLNPFIARERIEFLLELIDELTDALFKIHQLVQEGRKLDSNVDPGDKGSADPLPS